MSSADTEKDSDELDPDEPQTPLWLPLLGSGLFLLALLLFLATRSDEEPTAEASSDTAAEQAPAEQAPKDQAEAKAPDAPAQGNRAPARGDAPARPNRAPDDPHFGHDHD